MGLLDDIWNGVIAFARGSPAEQLQQVVSGNWVDTQWLGKLVAELEAKQQLDSPEVIKVMVVAAHQPLVWQALLRRKPGQVLEQIAALLDPGAPPSTRASIAQALYDRMCLVTPANEVPPELTAKVLERRKVLGADLPEAAWESPWPSGKVKKSKAAKAPELAAFTERFVLRDPITPIPEDEQRDRELLGRMPAFQGKRSLWALTQLGDQAALREWNSVEPDKVWVWGGELEMLVPRMGLKGLETSLKLVAAFPSGLSSVKDLESARLAPMMAPHLSGRPALRTVAREWFGRFPEAAATGLVPVMLSADRKEKLGALEAFRRLRKLDPAAAQRGLERYPPEVREAVETALVEGATMPGRKPSLPEWADPKALPRPVSLDGASSLQKTALFELLQVLAVTPLEGASWLEPLRARFTLDSMVRLSKALFYEWLGAGAPSKDRWALHALAHFSDAAMARELAALALEIAPRGLSARAQEMVEVLAAMQTRESLAEVHQLARRSRSKAFRARCELVFVGAAEKMGLSEDELAERLVPDFSLTPEGWLPVTPKVRLAVKKLKAVYLDEAGEPVKQVPDSADAEIQADLAELKKRANQLVKEGAERLELRMMLGRTMGFEHFTEVYLMHGLLRRLATGLVWGVFADGKVTGTFTIGEAGAEDVEGKPFTPPENARIGVVHPLALSELELAQWSQRKLEPVFAQLSRKLRKLSSTQELEQELRSLENRPVPVAALLRLEKSGWVRGPEIGRGCYVSYARDLGMLGRVELDFDPGIYLGDPMGSGEQTLTVLRAQLSPGVTPQVLSELERELREALTTPVPPRR
ncbi:MAG: DUF4132 domain-containing protein [Myxococcaceae bacterium]